MKKNIFSSLLLFCCLALIACNTPSPEKYFDLAILSTNMVNDFASEKPMGALARPSLKATDRKSKPVAMKRSEVIDLRIQFLESSYQKLKALKETSDTKEMLQTSLALYAYVLPIYKTAYIQLASLYDQDASKEEITSKIQDIHNKYYPRFNELYTKLIAIGKPYAEKHHIQVQWGF